MNYVGIDVHKKQWQISIVDEGGVERANYSLTGSWDEMAAAVEKIPDPKQIGFEVTNGAEWIYDHLRSSAVSVQAAHPKRLKIICESMKKNDKNDAHHLANLLRTGMFPATYIPEREFRAWRRLITNRERLVSDRTQIKNRIRALLKTHAIPSPKSLWTQKGLAWLKAFRFEDPSDNLLLTVQLSLLEAFDQNILRVEEELLKFSEKSAKTAVLETIPGVGIRTAEAVVAYVGRADRFPNARKASSYFGLVPRQDASAGKNHLGRITREGPALVRKLLVEAAWRSIKRDKGLRDFYRRIFRNDLQRKKKAAVATANKLLRAMVSMLKTGECWRREEKEVA